jgi:hypothetical protein
MVMVYVFADGNEVMYKTQTSITTWKPTICTYKKTTKVFSCAWLNSKLVGVDIVGSRVVFGPQGMAHCAWV